MTQRVDAIEDERIVQFQVMSFGVEDDGKPATVEDYESYTSALTNKGRLFQKLGNLLSEEVWEECKGPELDP